MCAWTLIRLDARRRREHDTEHLHQMNDNNHQRYQSISVSVSVLTLTCISIDRWYAICRPLEFCSTKYRAKITIALIWLASMLIASPDVIFLTTRPLYEENNYIYMDCTYSWPESNTKMYQLCIVTLLFVGPFVLMSISYWHIVNVLWRNETMAESLVHSIQLEDEQQAIQRKQRMNESMESQERTAFSAHDDRATITSDLNQYYPQEATAIRANTSVTSGAHKCNADDNNVQKPPSTMYKCSNPCSCESDKKDDSSVGNIDRIELSAKRSIPSNCQNRMFSAGRLCAQERELLLRQQSNPVISEFNATISSNQRQQTFEVYHDQKDHVTTNERGSSKGIASLHSSVCTRFPESTTTVGCVGHESLITTEKKVVERKCPLALKSLNSYTNESEMTHDRNQSFEGDQARYKHSIQAIIIEGDHDTENQHENRYQLIRNFDNTGTSYSDRKLDQLRYHVRANDITKKTNGVSLADTDVHDPGCLSHQSKSSEHAGRAIYRQQSVNQLVEIEKGCDGRKLETNSVIKVDTQSVANNSAGSSGFIEPRTQEVVCSTVESVDAAAAAPYADRTGICLENFNDGAKVTQLPIKEDRIVGVAIQAEGAVGSVETSLATSSLGLTDRNSEPLGRCATVANSKAWNCCKCLFSTQPPSPPRTKRKSNSQQFDDKLMVGGGKASKRYRKNMANYAAKRDRYRQWAPESFDAGQRATNRRAPGKLQKGVTICLDESTMTGSGERAAASALHDPPNNGRHGREIRIACGGTRIMGQNQPSQQHSTPCRGSLDASRHITTAHDVGPTSASSFINDDQLTGRANGNISLLANHHAASSQTTTTTRFCKLIESRKKAAKMLIVIVIMFGLCYLPIHFLNILRYTIGLPQNDFTTIASLVSHWLCYFNSAVNPLIYNLMSGKFRHEFANLFFCKCFLR